MGCKICSKDIKVNVEIHVTNENIKDTEELEKNMLIPLQSKYWIIHVVINSFVI